ncbi:hypothetical protein AC1031_003540 [Aphanomyces cochlioides]|nr:hypothetical protein AC1031_003540 [Aphanomyces cochlioides]
MSFSSFFRCSSSALSSPCEDGSVRMGSAKVFFYDNADSDRTKENCIKLSALYKVVLVVLDLANDFPPRQKTKPWFGWLEQFRPLAETYKTIQWIQQRRFESMRPHFDDVVAYMQQEHDVAKFAILGYSWGSNFAAKYCSIPGLPITAYFIGPDEKMGQQVLAPQLVLCSGDELSRFEPGKEVETDLKSRPFASEVRQFPDMPSGWVNHGDPKSRETITQLGMMQLSPKLPVTVINIVRSTLFPSCFVIC